MPTQYKFMLDPCQLQHAEEDSEAQKHLNAYLHNEADVGFAERNSQGSQQSNQATRDSIKPVSGGAPGSISSENTSPVMQALVMHKLISSAQMQFIHWRLQNCDVPLDEIRYEDLLKGFSNVPRTHLHISHIHAN